MVLEVKGLGPTPVPHRESGKVKYYYEFVPDGEMHAES